MKHVYQYLPENPSQEVYGKLFADGKAIATFETYGGTTDIDMTRDDLGEWAILKDLYTEAHLRDLVVHDSLMDDYYEIVTVTVDEWDELEEYLQSLIAQHLY